MKIVGTDDAEVERALLSGELGCPDCGARLGPWGSARWRVVRRPGVDERRRPRRSRCVGCAVTHVLIRTDVLLRRRDLAEVIGAALAARAGGLSQLRAVVLVGVHASTVRGWLRRFARNAEEIRARFTVLAHGPDPMLGPIGATATLFATWPTRHGPSRGPPGSPKSKARSCM